ncbi:MAG: hypothetical protein U0N20_04200 [Clostridium sp.]
MKRKLKRLFGGSIAVLLSMGLVTSPISASEQNEAYAHAYTENQVLVYNEEKDIYEVMDVNSVVQPRYTTTKTLDFGGIKVDCYINVDNNTGKITSTGIKKSNNKYAALYNVSFNSSKTIAYFTVTVYTYSIFGGIDSAVGTKYVTIYSGGPM